nr:reverse transcriptase domain-containing protein [Tanacetum cinerariifolium]
MQTRSSSRLVSNPSLNQTLSTNPNPKGRNRRRSKQRIEEFNLDELSPPIVMMSDQRTMAKLLQAPTEGYEDAIVVPSITTDNFELKHGLLTLVQNKQFFGHDKKDPHAHIRYFNKITSTLKFLNVPNTSIKLMLFPFSFKGAARIWLEKEAPRSIFTWDDLDRFKDILRACPHHGFTKLHQLDTFYNALNSKDQDSLNSADGVVAKVSTNTCTFGISPDVAELKDMVKALLLDKKSQNQASATMKAVEESCVTCVGAHSYRNFLATDGNIYCDNIQEFVSQASAVNYNQRNTSYRPPMMSNQIRPPGFPPVPNNQNVQLNQKNNQNCFIQNQNRGNNFNRGPVYQPPVFQPPTYQAPSPQTQGVSKENFSAYVKANDAFVNSNNASTSSSGTLPSNTIANPRSDLKAITTRSGVSYDGPQILPSTSFLPKVVENEPKTETPKIQISKPISEPINSPVSNPRPNLRPSIPYPSRMQDQKLRDKANDQHEKIFQIFKDLNFNISFADALILMPRFGPSIKSLLTNKDKLYELARTPLNEHCSAVLLKKLPEKPRDPGKFLIHCDFPGKAQCLALADLDASINLMPLSVWNKLSLPDLTPTCMYLELADRSISYPVGVAEDVYVKVGSFHFPTDFVVVDFDANPRVPLILDRSFLMTRRALIDVFKEAFLNDDPSLPPPNQGNYLREVRKELKICEVKSDKSSIDEPQEVEVKDLPPHLEYAFLEGDDKFPIIFAKDLSVEEKTALIMVLNSHKRAIAWKLSDIKGFDPEFCTHKTLMGEDFEPAVQHQRRVHRKIHDVIKQEVLKLLNAGLIYPISDSPWVSPVHYVSKKGGFTVVENEDNELILTRLVMGWRVCIDYCKLNEATHKDYFPLPFMDQMLERLAGNQYYCFLNGFFGYFQIPIDLKDQEKTTFTCPYRTFAYRRIPFGLCNAPGTFQSCLSYLERMLKRCEDTNLCLNWEKSHFMVKVGIVLGHKISKQGIKVEKAKVDVITKLPHPTTVKECVEAFQALKRKLTEAPILISPDWDMPFELMCDASDFAIGAVLGQRQEKTKRLHDSKNKDRVFNIDDRVLLFNSRLKIFSGKLKSHWSGRFTISHVYPYGTVELSQPDGPNFKVNGHRLKHYFGEDVPKVVVPDLQTFPRDH